MSDAENKALPSAPDPAPEPVGSGKPAVASIPPIERPTRQPKGTVPPRHEPKRDPRETLSQDALEAARVLKRKHRAYYDTDPKGFRALVVKAHSRVFRLKPGPKPNARIAQAARERGQGVPMEDLYRRYIDNYEIMTEYTRALAEEGLRRRINQYLQRHRRLRRKLPGGTVVTRSAP